MTLFGWRYKITTLKRDHFGDWVIRYPEVTHSGDRSRMQQRRIGRLVFMRWQHLDHHGRLVA